MLDILIGSLMVALALVVVFWVLIFGRPLVRETKIVRRPYVNNHRISTTVEERHVYSDGLDITLDYDTGGPMNKIKAITGTPSRVRMFITKMWKEGTQKIVFKEWGL